MDITYKINAVEFIQTFMSQVQDVNDEAPVFESETYYVTAAENTPSKSNIIKGLRSGVHSVIIYTIKKYFDIIFNYPFS